MRGTFHSHTTAEVFGVYSWQRQRMDLKVYLHYLEQYVREALENSDGTNAGISDYLWEKQVSGLMVRHRFEKRKALNEARKAFDEHRHWPVEIVLSHLGIAKISQPKE